MPPRLPRHCEGRLRPAAVRLPQSPSPVIARKAGRRCRWQKEAARFFRSRAVGGPSRSRPGNGNCGKACRPPLTFSVGAAISRPPIPDTRPGPRAGTSPTPTPPYRRSAPLPPKGDLRPPIGAPRHFPQRGKPPASPSGGLGCAQCAHCAVGGPRQRWRGIPCKRADPILPYDTGSSLPVGAAISRPRITSQVGPTGGDKPHPYAPLSALRATSPKGGSPQPPPPGALGVPSAHTGVATAHCRRRSLSPLCA